MAIIKCKMCGGDLNLVEGSTVAECEYCGTTQTVPAADNEKKMTLFARANRLRAACEFDKAAGVYESIVAEFPEEAEAYWGLLLCKFGIEYVDDPATGKKIPTCHRSSFDSIMDDSDFEQVMENADAIARRLYREEAKQIEELRKRIIEVSSKEEPYDIFICYKETDENGSRTIDSVIAQDVYDALTEKGYKVFFARITLEDKLGQEYEPYIFAALNSAKIMLAFGTDYEYYNAVWVKNEWSRFLALIAKGEKKTLIPCYKGIDAYDMPKEFKHLQAQDMGKVGAMQDLLRGIEKIIPLKVQKSAAQTVSQHVSHSGPNVDSLLKRGYMSLEDKEWEKAKAYFDQVLNADAENAEAYLGIVMADSECSNRDAFAELVVHDNQKFITQKEYNRAKQFGGKELTAWFTVIENKRLSEIESKYVEACEYQESGEEEKLAQAIELFTALIDYKDSARRAKECSLGFNEIKAKRKDREEKQRIANIERLKPIRDRLLPYSKLLSCKGSTTVGLKEDGTVLATGNNENDQCNVSSWRDIVAVAAGNYHTVGLKENGTVVAVGARETKEKGEGCYSTDYSLLINQGQCNVSNMSGIVRIAAGEHHTAGLKSDGTVVCEGVGKGDAFFMGDQTSPCDTYDWKDVVAVAAGGLLTAGLKSNGTVVVEGFQADDCRVSDWTDIVSIAVEDSNVVGLKADGTVVKASCFHYNGVLDWNDIVAIAEGNDHTVGLKADGTIVTTDYWTKDEVSMWTDIVAIAAGKDYTVGLKSDGTVVAVGKNDDGQCNVSDWKLFRSEAEKKADYNTAYESEKDDTEMSLSIAIKTFAGLKDYKDSAERKKACEQQLSQKISDRRRAEESARKERERAEKKAKLKEEKTSLQTEFSNLKGLFSGKRRKEIEARLAEIDHELNQL